MALVALLAMIGCCTSGTVREGGVVGGIGDDACALMLEYHLTVMDPEARPLSDVDLWRVDRRHIQGKALRIGSTNASGRLVELDCYMGTLKFGFWHPEEEPVHLHLMLLREGYGLKHIRLTPPVQEVLDAGNVLGVPPGESVEWSKVKPGSERKSYRVVLDTTLEPTTHR